MIQIMKRVIYVFMSAVLLAACSKEELHEPSVIPDAVEQTEELDRWIQQTFTEPYNIEIVYRSGKMNMSPGDYAPKTEKVMDVLKAIEALWVDVYSSGSVGGQDFLRGKMPLRIRLIGGKKLNIQGEELIANPSATGIDMYIYNVNDFDAKNEDDVFCLMRSVHFQFAKRLLELIPYDRDKFMTISKSRYMRTPQGVLIGDTKAKRKTAFDISFYANKHGCYSSFGFSSPEDDMADMISVLLTHKPNVEQSILDNAAFYEIQKDDPVYTQQLIHEAEQAVSELTQKQVILKAYFDKNVGLSLKQLQLNSIDKLINYTK